MGVHLRICGRCGESERTGSYARLCRRCYEAVKTEARIVEERSVLESLYSNVVGPAGSQHNHRLWTFTHECSHRQTWTFPNFRKQRNLRPDSVPCSKCGGKERMSKALTAFVEKFGIKDIEVWERYSQKARGLTEKVYKANLAELNPHGYKRTRGSKGWHLDHKKPIVQCFLDGDPPEFAARKENLEMMLAFENLSKGRRIL